MACLPCECLNYIAETEDSLPFHLIQFLLLAFMGKQHGRITQIVVEDGKIVLQYSKLWSFEVEDTAPVELFVRYITSQPIGLERPYTGSSLRLDPVTGMPTT